MSYYWKNTDDSEVFIHMTTEENFVIQYKIDVRIGNIMWQVSHRYSEFFSLHAVLVEEHGVARDLLPPKRYVNTMSPEFIEERRGGLDTYIKTVFNYLQRRMPKVLVLFLEMEKYDVYFILPVLSEHFYLDPTGKIPAKAYTFHVLELHAISRVFKEPLPAIEEAEVRVNYDSILEVCSQMERICLEGSVRLYKHSSIMPNALSIDFSNFKSLKSLEISGNDLRHVYSLGYMRTTLTHLTINNVNVPTVAHLLLADAVHKNVINEIQMWRSLTHLDLRNCQIAEIDISIRLVPNLIHLDLTNNLISVFPDLSFMYRLQNVDLSSNQIINCGDLHTKMGNIRRISLSDNHIVSLNGFQRLYSLDFLDLSFNKIVEMNEVKNLACLPNLEFFVLTGNDIASLVDYRVKVFEMFMERVDEIYLDNERANQKELDAAQILRALNIRNQGRGPESADTPAVDLSQDAAPQEAASQDAASQDAAPQQ